MDLFRIKCSKFTNNSNYIKIKLEIDRKINLYSYFIDYGFKKFETIYDEKLSDLLYGKFRLYNFIVVFKEIQKVKSSGLEKNKGKLILLTKCVVFESKKSRFMETKKQTHC